MKNKLDKWVKSFKCSCLTKKAYRTAGFAQEIAKKVLKERGTKLYCYWCRECGSYHLTSRPPKDGKESMERVF